MTDNNPGVNHTVESKGDDVPSEQPRDRSATTKVENLGGLEISNLKDTNGGLIATTTEKLKGSGVKSKDQCVLRESSDHRDEQYQERHEATGIQTDPRISPSPLKTATCHAQMSLPEKQPKAMFPDDVNLRADDFDWERTGPQESLHEEDSPVFKSNTLPSLGHGSSNHPGQHLLTDHLGMSNVRTLANQICIIRVLVCRCTYHS
jgi:hypothetical protein